MSYSSLQLPRLEDRVLSDPEHALFSYPPERQVNLIRQLGQLSNAIRITEAALLEAWFLRRPLRDAYQATAQVPAEDTLRGQLIAQQNSSLPIITLHRAPTMSVLRILRPIILVEDNSEDTAGYIQHWQIAHTEHGGVDIARSLYREGARTLERRDLFEVPQFTPHLSLGEQALEEGRASIEAILSFLKPHA